MVVPREAGGEPTDSLYQFAGTLRGKGGIECRSAVLSTRGEGDQRFDVFRGKDFVRWVKAHPEAAAGVALQGKAPEPDALPAALGALLLRRQLVLRVDRASQKLAPGAKKLVKFPRKLVELPRADATTFVEDGFYVWLYKLPASKLTYALAALLPLGVIAACCFPLAPNWAKVWVFYISAGLLILILATLALRSAVALATWVASGRTVWLLPNLLSEEVAMSQLLKPLVSVERPAEGGSKWSSHPVTRLAVGAAVAGLLVFLHQHSPGKAAVAKEAGRMQDEVMQWLGVQRDGYQRLEGNAPPNATANATAAGEGSAAAAAEADLQQEAEGAAEAADVDAGDAAAGEEGHAEL